MRFAWLALGAGFLGATALAQPASAPEAAASAVANAMRGQLPMETNGIVMRRVDAQGDLLIITVELPSGASDLDRSEYVRGFIAGTCETQPNPLFANRVRLRIDTYVQSVAQQSAVFTDCPAPAVGRT
ncbi:hypothetical protein [Allosphingosinicella sp.]|jgi:hypothetical protein|uniref:hypothetical protein n=1 Tax=Allosphingosinicella sp. TaxID=2823234 RepID=UPI002EEC4171